MLLKRRKGFTLSELLICLAILGVIATFTIPKVLQSQQNARSNAIAHETAGMVSEAYSNYKLKNSSNASTGMNSLTPYLNYVSVVTSYEFDDIPGSWITDCGGGANICLKLHNGAGLWYNNGEGFGGTGTTNAIRFSLDPDGTYSNTLSNGPSKSIQFTLYYDGKIRSWATLEPNSCSDMGCRNPTPSKDPSWFSWN